MSYVCQRCKLPLVIDESLKDLSKAQTHLLTLNYGTRPAQLNVDGDVEYSENNYEDSQFSESERPSLKNTRTVSKNSINDQSNTRQSSPALITNKHVHLPESRRRQFEEAMNDLDFPTTDHSNKINNSNSDMNNISNRNVSPPYNYKNNNSTNDGNGSNGSFVILDKKMNNKIDHSIINDSNKQQKNITNNDNNNHNINYNNVDFTPNQLIRNQLNETSTTLNKIFEVLSSKYEIDYPICQDCSSLLISKSKSKFENLNKDKESYVHFLKKLTLKNSSSSASTSASTYSISKIPNEKINNSIDELNNLKDKENKILLELKQLDQKFNDLNDEYNELNLKLNELDLKEQNFYLIKNKNDLEINNLNNEYERIKSLYSYSVNELDNLRNKNIYNDIFNISIFESTNIGTINGLRLGYSDKLKISDYEINAALGQIILLLSIVINKLNLKINNYKLYPLGSNSYIEVINTKYDKNWEKIDIFRNESNATFPAISDYFNGDKKFDKALYNLLKLTDLIKNNLIKIDNSNVIPFKIENYKINGYSIQFSSGKSNDEWNNACNSLLITCKWLLTYLI